MKHVSLLTTLLMSACGGGGPGWANLTVNGERLEVKSKEGLKNWHSELAIGFPTALEPELDLRMGPGESVSYVQAHTTVYGGPGPAALEVTDISLDPLRVEGIFHAVPGSDDEVEGEFVARTTCTMHRSDQLPYCPKGGSPDADPSSIVYFAEDPACPVEILDRWFPGGNVEEVGPGASYGGGETIPAKGNALGLATTMDIDGCTWQIAIYGHWRAGGILTLTARETEACAEEVPMACLMTLPIAPGTSGLNEWGPAVPVP